MKTYIADIIPKIQKFSQKLDDLTKLTNQHWVSIGEIGQTKRVYIFRSNNQILISDNGIVERGSWEYLGNQSLLMNTKEGSYLLKQGFFDQNIIALKLDGTNNYAFFVNETKYDKELNNIEDIFDFLNREYIIDYNKSDDNSPINFVFSENDIWVNSEFVSDEQKEWMGNPDKCPGCGFSSVINKSECPECGLQLI